MGALPTDGGHGRSAALRGLSPPYAISRDFLPYPRDRLEIPLVLAGEAQHEVRAARAHVLVEPLGDARHGPRVAHLPLAHHRRHLAVIALEETVELAVGAGDIVVEHDVEIHTPD